MRKRNVIICIDGDGNEQVIDCDKEYEESPYIKKIRGEVRETMKPLYDSLGVDIDTEAIHWTSGEVFVRNKKTGKRREIEEQTQPELNKKLFNHALETGKRTSDNSGYAKDLKRGDKIA